MIVYIIAALSKDGYITDNKTDQIKWTSEEDKEFFKQKTLSSGVVVMGNKTYKAIGRPLSGRLNIVYSSNINLKNVSGFEYTNVDPVKLINELKIRGFSEVAIIGGQQIYSLFMKSGVITDLYLTTEPISLGGGLTLFSKDVDYSDFKLVETKMLNTNTTLSHYQK